MQVTNIVSFDGVDFASLNWEPWVLEEQGTWTITPNIEVRQNGTPEFSGATIEPRSIPVKFIYRGTDNITLAKTRLLGVLNPIDVTPRTLIGTMPLDTPTNVQCDAVVQLVPADNEDELNTINVVFLTASPTWIDTTPITESAGTIVKRSSGGFDDLLIEGMAPVHAQIRLTPVALDNQVLEQFVEITNNGTQPMVNFPLKIDCGNQGDGTSLAALTYKTLLLDGVPQRSEFVNWGWQQAYLWLVVPYLSPGETARFQVLTSGSYELESPSFNSYTQPAFDYGWENDQATGGSTTTFVLSTATWETNKWRGGYLTMLTGPNAGLTRDISSNTGTTLTTAAFPNANASGNRGLIHMSSNGKWVYPVRQTERNNNQRGLWWIDQGQKRPSDWRFDVPGGWHPYLYYDNADQFVQTNYTEVNVGTKDFFAILNAWRTWETGKAIKNDGLGGADGISISMPFPITSLRLTEQMRNPNGMCKFIVGSRAIGSDAFIEEYANTNAYSTLTNVSVHTVTMTADTTQLYLGLIPGLDADGNQKDEIGNDWGSDKGTATIGDTGTATSATSTTLVDSSKSWANDLYNGYTVIITSGTGAGQTRSITDTSGGNTLTVAAWGTTPDSTSQYTIARRTAIEDSSKNWVNDQWIGGVVRIIGGRGRGASGVVTDSTATTITANFGVLIDSTSQYIVTNKDAQAIVRTNDIFELNWDTSDIAISALSPQRKAYVLDRSLYVDRDQVQSDPPYQVYRFSYFFTGRHIVLYQGESLIISGEESRAYIDARRTYFVGTSTPAALSNGANVIGHPSGTDLGDTIIAIVRNNNAAILTAPVGFSAIETFAVGGTTYTVYQGVVSDNNGTVTWAYGSAPSSATIMMASYRNLGDLVDSAHANATAATSHLVGPVDILDEQSMVLTFLMTPAGVTLVSGPTGFTNRLINTSNYLRDRRYDDLIDTPQTFTYQTMGATNSVTLALVFRPTFIPVAVPPRSIIVYDQLKFDEWPGASRMAERWLYLTPGAHDIKLSAVAQGNDYNLELTYSPAYFG